MAKGQATEEAWRVNERYKAEHYDRVYVRIPKGQKDAWIAAANAIGQPSLTRYRIDAVNRRSESGE